MTLGELLGPAGHRVERGGQFQVRLLVEGGGVLFRRPAGADESDRQHGCCSLVVSSPWV